MPPHVEPAGALWDDADLVLAIGSDLDGVQTQNFAMPQPPALVAVNLDAEDAGKNYRVDVMLEGDAAQVASALADRLDGGGDLAPVTERLHRVRAAACSALDGRALRFLDAIHFALPDESVLVADMCVPGYWLAGFHTPAAPRRLQIPLGWGTLGYAFPAAMGAALAGRGPAVAVVGDGGFLFACGELATIAQERIPLTTAIVDDSGGTGCCATTRTCTATSATASTSTRPTSPPWPLPSGSTPRPSTSSRTSSARHSRGTCSSRSRPCWWSARRNRSCRRPTPRRTGTPAALAAPRNHQRRGCYDDHRRG